MFRSLHILGFDAMMEEASEYFGDGWYLTIFAYANCIYSVLMSLLIRLVINNMSYVCVFTSLARIARTTYVDTVYCYRPTSVLCRSVGRFFTLVSPAKTAEPIEMPFG